MQVVPVVRSLTQAPRETVLAVLALGAGIGLTTMLFSIVKGVMSTEIAAGQVERVVRINAEPSLVAGFRSQQTTLEDIGSVVATGVNSEIAGVPRRLRAGYVSANFLDILQAQPIAGTARVDNNAGRSILLSHSLWQSSFGGRADVLGRPIRLNGVEFTVVGVMPARFAFPRSEDVWALWDSSRETVQARGRGSDAFLFGRLKAGVSIENARAELQTIARRLRPAAPNEPPAPNIEVSLFASSHIKGEVRILLTALLICCFFVLLIACANVANLSLARAARRLHELGLRSALGASRKQLVSLLLSESLLLSVLGALVGVALAAGGIQVFVSEISKETALTGGMPAGMAFKVDGIVLAFVSVLAIATAMVSGLIPAMRVTSLNLEQLIRGGSRAITIRSGRFGTALIHVQLAASVLLLVGTGVMGSMWARMGASVRYDPDKILSARLEVAATEYPAATDRNALFAKLETELKGAPVVAAAALSTAEHVERTGSANVVAEGRIASRSSDALPARWQAVSPGFFDVFESRLVEGRFFDPRDGASTPAAAIVNQTFAKRHWGDGNALGKRFRLNAANGPEEWINVVGVVTDIGQMKSSGQESLPAFYRPLAQTEAAEVSLLVRSRTDARQALPTVVRVVRGLTSSPLFQVHTATEIMDMEAVGLRVPAMLFALCGLSGLLLSAVGTYGVLSLAARQRTREIGIRLALGATPEKIFRSMVLQGSRQVLIGICAGLAAGMVLTRVLYSLFDSLQWLIGINVVVALILAVVGMVSVAVPAFAASRLQPHIALRE